MPRKVGHAMKAHRLTDFARQFPDPYRSAIAFDDNLAGPGKDAIVWGKFTVRTTRKRKRSPAHWITSPPSDVMKTSIGPTGRQGLRTKANWPWRLSCSAPITPGQTPPTPTFKAF
ncbi:unnamed protein product [Strongylus vulgaris]|uniref:Uncharacterized protein n=1 Tax=Strongylus vulgaris TaxID=40348 RepID=A0A3P7IKI0_STRVU|nr:unnamed protein product [Strongylus vulgaris]